MSGDGEPDHGAHAIQSAEVPEVVHDLLRLDPLGNFTVALGVGTASFILLQEQLEGVLDPMSGAFLSAHSENPNGDLKVCNQTLPVFDGRQRFDLVLTDVMMPRLDGYQVVRRMRALPALGATVFVALSGYGREELFAAWRSRHVLMVEDDPMVGKAMRDGLERAPEHMPAHSARIREFHARVSGGRVVLRPEGSPIIEKIPGEKWDNTTQAA